MLKRETFFDIDIDLDLSDDAWAPRFVIPSAEEILEMFVNDDFEDVRLFNLRIQAEYLALVRGTDYPYSMFASRATLYPHQVGVVCKVVAECKRGALLADEVGLGKTIEAGMILKELACRRQARSVLILAPSALLTKWVQELENRFGERCVIYDAKTRSELYKRYGNIWEANSRIVCSIDTAKQPRYRDEISKVDWDLVVVDEAHRLRNSSTENHKLLLELRRKMTLLLTATPMQNSINELYNLVSLIDRGVLGSPEYFKMRFVGTSGGTALKNAKEMRQRLQTVMVRNLKKNVYLGIGHKLTGRVGQTLSFELTSKELELYREVSRYASGEYLKAVEANNAGRGFLLIMMQRMVCSSSFAIRDCLKRRIERLRWLLQKDDIRSEAKERRPKGNVAGDDWNIDVGEAHYSPSDDVTQEYFLDEIDDNETSLEGDGGLDLFQEIRELEFLYELARSISVNSKGEKLLEAINSLLKEEPDVKILVFTEFRSTQKYIANLLHEAGYGVVCLNGSLTKEEKDLACLSWRDDPSRKIMISTEVGGEGKDFQFCHILFNYDLPWNPMRVEQRIGRLDRIGQSHTVRIFNLSTIGTVEEHVLDLLDEKIGLFRNAIGDVDLILGDLVRTEKRSFQQMIMQIHAKAVTMESEEEGKRFRQLASKIEAARRAFENGIKHINKSVWSNMDLSVWREVMGSEIKQYVKEDKEKVKSFFLGFLGVYGEAPVFLEKDVLSFHLPSMMADASGRIEDDVVKATFEANAAQKNPSLELVSFGSNLLTTAIDVSRNRGKCAKKDLNLGKDLKGREFLNFNFKISICGLISDERLMSVTLSLPDGSLLQLSDEATWSEGKNYSGEVHVDREVLDRLYKKSLDTLQPRIKEWVETIKERCKTQYRREETSINEYYIQADDALREQEACLQRQCDNVLKKKNEAHTYDTIAMLDKEYMRLRNQLLRLRRNNQKKRAELSESLFGEMMQLKERNKIVVTISLINLAYIHASH